MIATHSVQLLHALHLRLDAYERAAHARDPSDRAVRPLTFRLASNFREELEELFAACATRFPDDSAGAPFRRAWCFISQLFRRSSSAVSAERCEVELLRAYERATEAELPLRFSEVLFRQYEALKAASYRARLGIERPQLSAAPMAVPASLTPVPSAIPLRATGSKLSARTEVRGPQLKPDLAVGAGA